MKTLQVIMGIVILLVAQSLRVDCLEPREDALNQSNKMVMKTYQSRHKIDLPALIEKVLALRLACLSRKKKK